jgi:hypothetical protein
LVRRSVDPEGTSPTTIEQYVLEGGRRALTLTGGTTSATVSRRYQYGVTGEVLYDQLFNAVGQSTERYEPLGDRAVPKGAIRRMRSPAANDISRQTSTAASFALADASVAIRRKTRPMHVDLGIWRRQYVPYCAGFSFGFSRLQ